MYQNTGSIKKVECTMSNTNTFKRLKTFLYRAKKYNFQVAYEIRQDSLHPPGKSPRYIQAISKYMDHELSPVIKKYKNTPIPKTFTRDSRGPIPIWVCWWQGEANMPETVKLCYSRLIDITSDTRTELHLITLDNYIHFVSIPAVFIDKYKKGMITMTHLSDILRCLLLEKYGGYWIDATVFFTGNIPEKYFTAKFYSQKMEHYDNYPDKIREASGSRWCGFSMAAEQGCFLMQFINESLLYWWNRHDELIDYVILDYIIYSGYKNIPAIKVLIDQIDDNNEDIFEMRKYLNNEYSEELYNKLTSRNVMHKLTYKTNFNKTTNNKMTIYGHLFTLTAERT